MKVLQKKIFMSIACYFYYDFVGKKLNYCPQHFLILVIIPSIHFIFLLNFNYQLLSNANDKSILYMSYMADNFSSKAEARNKSSYLNTENHHLNSSFAHQWIILQSKPLQVGHCQDLVIVYHLNSVIV